MDEISYFSQSAGKLETIYSRFSSKSQSWIGLGSLQTDGKRLTLVAKPYEGRTADLIVYDIESQKQKTVVSMPYVFGPKWSPDGNRIAFSSRSGSRGNFDLNVYEIATAQSSQVLLAELPSGEGYFDWSPDGQRIIYENAAGDIGVLDVQTKKSRFLGKGGSPKWSPDGKLICYHKDGEDAVVLQNIEGTENRTMLVGKHARGLIWSPDGRYIAYSRPYGALSKQLQDLSQLVDTYGDLWVIDTQSGEEVKLFTAGESIYPTYWGPIALSSAVSH
jgi:Tol biopolymer transport system component